MTFIWLASTGIHPESILRNIGLEVGKIDKAFYICHPLKMPATIWRRQGDAQVVKLVDMLL